ncbi:MAG: hypothetical protein Q4C89_03655 [Deinococcus sp.]|uniref:hypothetical protein n=1 Tax=Deinococcus sp. TaxID=47478 RepID=UPI0026DD6DA0|nr:hypothetical protein [Deinococcus sp.]MDO4245099.1 hypothetical protein [Deinococcus sp.]
MKRLSIKALLGGIVLTSALVSCGQNGSAPDLGGLPPLATGITVRFDAAPANTYLTLSTEGGEVVYQKAVSEGAMSFAPDLNDWRSLSSRAAPIKLNTGVTTEPLLFLKWGMFQDKNTNGKPDEGEWLDRMTHDRVAYAEKAVKVEFDTETPAMHHVWTLNQGWTRAEHYVYRPLGSSTFQRLSRSTAAWDFWLHTATPVTSM